MMNCPLNRFSAMIIEIIVQAEVKYKIDDQITAALRVFSLCSIVLNADTEL